MSRLQIELDHLVSLMAPPFRENFKAFCWDKALRLAETDAAEFAELPALLKAAMQSDSNGSTRAQPCIDQSTNAMAAESERHLRHSESTVTKTDR